MISGSHIRAARKLLNWGPDRLAKRARLAVGIVLQAERDEDLSLISASATRSIQQALEDAGVEWTEPPALVRFRA